MPSTNIPGTEVAAFYLELMQGGVGPVKTAASLNTAAAVPASIIGALGAGTAYMAAKRRGDDKKSSFDKENEADPNPGVLRRLGGKLGDLASENPVLFSLLMGGLTGGAAFGGFKGVANATRAYGVKPPSPIEAGLAEVAKVASRGSLHSLYTDQAMNGYGEMIKLATQHRAVEFVDSLEQDELRLLAESGKSDLVKEALLRQVAAGLRTAAREMPFIGYEDAARRGWKWGAEGLADIAGRDAAYAAQKAAKAKAAQGLATRMAFSGDPGMAEHGAKRLLEANKAAKNAGDLANRAERHQNLANAVVPGASGRSPVAAQPSAATQPPTPGLFHGVSGKAWPWAAGGAAGLGLGYYGKKKADEAAAQQEQLDGGYGSPKMAGLLKEAGWVSETFERFLGRAKSPLSKIKRVSGLKKYKYGLPDSVPAAASKAGPAAAAVPAVAAPKSTAAKPSLQTAERPMPHRVLDENGNYRTVEPKAAAEAPAAPAAAAAEAPAKQRKVVKSTNWDGFGGAFKAKGAEHLSPSGAATGLGDAFGIIGRWNDPANAALRAKKPGKFYGELAGKVAPGVGYGLAGYGAYKAVTDDNEKTSSLGEGEDGAARPGLTSGLTRAALYGGGLGLGAQMASHMATPKFDTKAAKAISALREAQNVLPAAHAPKLRGAVDAGEGVVNVVRWLRSRQAAKKLPKRLLLGAGVGAAGLMGLRVARNAIKPNMRGGQEQEQGIDKSAGRISDSVTAFLESMARRRLKPKAPGSSLGGLQKFEPMKLEPMKLEPKQLGLGKEAAKAPPAAGGVDDVVLRLPKKYRLPLAILVGGFAAGRYMYPKKPMHPAQDQMQGYGPGGL